MMKSLSLRLAPAMMAAALASAQPAQRPPSPEQTVKSPEVSADHKVTFRIYAPKAGNVEVTGDWVAQGRGTGGKLTKDEQGVWSITVGPLTPDLYAYTLTVDGVRTMDPRNPDVKHGVSNLENLVYVPGPEAAFEDNVQVPHGEIRQVWYFSKSLDQMRRMHVYTPPGYEQGTAKLPVFYLLHGGGDEDSGWSTIGRAGFILDNLIAAGKAKPMLVVMPNGSVSLPGVTMGQGGRRTASGQVDMSDAMNRLHDAFGEDLLGSVIPYVEGHYRVLASQPNRAIAGLSMGGAETLRIAPRNIDKFAYIGVWSMGWHDHINPDLETRNEKFFGNSAETNKLVKLFWIGCGSKDALIGDGAKRLSELLTRHGIKNEYHGSDGGHTWINWRAYLRDYAQLLFR